MSSPFPRRLAAAVVAAALTCAAFSVAGPAQAAPSHVLFDRNGDGKADVGVYRLDGSWYFPGAVGNSAPLIRVATIRMPGDYDGDGTTELGEYAYGSARWVIEGQPAFTFGRPVSKTSFDWPVVADWDGDGDEEVAVFRSGAWYVRGGASGVFGRDGDEPAQADYNGDGVTDRAIFRRSNHSWYVQGGVQGVAFGRVGDLLVPADYDGDGDADIAIYRPSNGTWYVRGAAAVAFGRAEDFPVPADYDGDGDIDIAVFRPSTATWYIRRPGQIPLAQKFGKPSNAQGYVDYPWLRPAILVY